MVSQEDKQWMCVFTIDLNLFKDWEFGIEVFINKLSNLLKGSTFLAEELIAGEGQDLESFWTKLLMHLHHGLIVGTGQSSLACYVDNHNGFFIFEGGEVN